jgi:hypothetical protein
MLKRRILDPIRLVLPDDDAIGPESDYQAYLDGWCDWQHLKLVEGAKPSVFTVAPLTHRQRIARDQHGTRAAQMDYTVRASIRAVSNVTIERPGGEIETLDAPQIRDGLVTSEWMDRAGFTEDEFGALYLAAAAVTEVQLPFLSRLGHP